MLTDLHVKNMALIDEAEVSFGPGLNILTGETGAGKSILIGSISLALGQKMAKGILRKGAEEGMAELVFQVENPAVLKKLEEMDVKTEDGLLILTRKFSESRSLSRINGEACTLAKMKEVSQLLLDIHGQHEHQSLLYKDRQLAILDDYSAGEILPQRAKVEEAYHAYHKVKKDLDAYSMNAEEQQRERDFLQFEVDEIEKAALKEGEEEELEKQYRKLSNAKKILEALGSAYRMTGDEGAGDLTGQALQELESVADYDDSLKDMTATLEDIENLLSDFNREASEYLDNFSFSDEEFVRIEGRLDTINRLKAKYGRRAEDVLAYLDEKKKRLDELDHFEERKAKLEKEAKAAFERLNVEADTLTKLRRAWAGKLSEQIRQGLMDLNFQAVGFRIDFTGLKECQRNGRDEICFMISTNPGEPVKPLSGVVSGGELSRIMLAIKTLLADKDQTETLIFDEIDTGISGRTAQKVSEKMARIAKNHQVLCITHLAQIAAMADRHFEIEKDVEGGKTVTHVKALDPGESVEELARILGGSEITQAVRSNAAEMKKLADQKKEEIRA